MLLMAAAPAAGQEAPPGLENPIEEPIGNSRIGVGLETVADGLTAPLWGTAAPNHFHHLYVVDQPGLLWAIDTRDGEKTVIADLSDLLVPLGVFGPGSFDERGFLGVAFDKGYKYNGYIYTVTSEAVDGPADFSTIPDGAAANHQSVISRWTSTDSRNPVAPIDPASRKILLRVDQPQFNHNAGAIEVGPDGLLYIGFGDGGGADDTDGQPFIGGPIIGHGTGNSQDLTNPLGSILRIDPYGDNSANGAYGIPRRNPFVGDGVVEEIYAYGFRNPYRMSFDRDTGRLWAADVGQNDIEEVDIVRRGGNYGWNLKEGSFVFDANGNDDGFVTAPADLGTIDPVAEYDHDEGVAIVGGYVYRGRRIDDLQGRYVFGEFARTFSNDGRLFATRGRSGVIEELLLPEQDGLGLSLLGFGQDRRGELYVLGNSTGTPFGDTGVVQRLVEVEAERRFEAELSGAAEVPPVESDASGRATLRADRRWTELEYRISVRDLEGVTQAHIHIGPEGENGPVATFLFGPGDPIDIRRGELVRATITADDLIGSFEGKPLSALLVEMQAGNAYINVHTTGVPSGEIRGQIRPGH